MERRTCRDRERLLCAADANLPMLKYGGLGKHVQVNFFSRLAMDRALDSLPRSEKRVLKRDPYVFIRAHPKRIVKMRDSSFFVARRNAKLRPMGVIAWRRRRGIIERYLRQPVAVCRHCHGVRGMRLGIHPV